MKINLSTITFKEEVIKNINDSGLPAVNVMLVLESILKEVQNELLKQINEESKEKTE